MCSGLCCAFNEDGSGSAGPIPAVDPDALTPQPAVKVRAMPRWISGEKPAFSTGASCVIPSGTVRDREHLTGHPTFKNAMSKNCHPEKAVNQGLDPHKDRVECLLQDRACLR
jgi:hypothetical protein